MEAGRQRSAEPLEAVSYSGHPLCGTAEASKLSCCRRGERKHRGKEPEARTEAAPGGDEREGLPSDLSAGAVGTPRKRKRVDVGSEGRFGKRRTAGPWRAAERILGHERIEGSEPCKACEEDEE